MYFSVRKTKNIELIKELHAKCFPEDEWEDHEKSFHWVAMDRDGVPLGFASAFDFGCNILFFARAGVLAKFRGHGIHTRAIKTRIRFARLRGFTRVITYTSIENSPSANNLIDCGFRLFNPEEAWVGEEYNYWLLTL